MPQGQGLDNYASPILRASVFRRLHPGAQISYTVVPIDEAFPMGHRTYEGEATEAVRCEIVFPDGHWVIAHKEIDVKDRGRARAQTPEELAKDETKALGRALRDCGIPQRLTELKMVMAWVASMDGHTVAALAAASTTHLPTVPVDDDDGHPDDDDVDAGADPTPEQITAEAFSRLNGVDKAAVSKHARDVMDVPNVMRAGDKADDLLAYIESRAWHEKEEPF